MTTVNINVTDTAGQAWANGTVSAQLQTAFGAHLNVPPVTSALDGSGNATITLAPNLAITPPGSGWFITACPAATAPCYARAYTIAGDTQNLNIVPPAIKINLESTRAVTLPIHATAYSFAEIAGAQIGSIYYDLTQQALMVLESLPANWVPVGGDVSGFATIAFVENLVSNPPFFNTIAGIPSVSQGVAVAVQSSNGSEQQGTTTQAAGIGSNGVYRVNFYINVTTTSTTDTLQVSITYTDDSGANSQVFPASPISTIAAHTKIAGSTILNSIDGNIPFSVLSSDGTAFYAAYLFAEFLG